MSGPVPLMTGTTQSLNPGIPTSRGNPTSYVQAEDINNKSFVPPDWEPWPDLDPDGRL